MADLCEFGDHTAGELSVDVLSGKSKSMHGKGVLDVALSKQDLLHHRMHTCLETRTFTQHEKAKAMDVFQTSDSFRKQYNVYDVSWLGKLSAAGRRLFNLIEEVVDGQKHDRQIVEAIRTGKTIEDVLGDDPRCDRVHEIDTALENDRTKDIADVAIDHGLLKTCGCSEVLAHVAVLEVTDAAEKHLLE